MAFTARVQSGADASCSARCSALASEPTRPHRLRGSCRAQRQARAALTNLPTATLPAPSRRQRSQSRAGPVAAAAAAAPTLQDVSPSEELIQVPVPDPEERNEDGTPVVHWVTMTRAELQEAEALEAAIVERTRLAEELAQQAVRARDLHRLDVRGPAATRSGGSKVQVPSVRTVVDPAAVELIGDGLPVIRGAEYPAAYGESLTRLSKGDPIPVPRPHPKFSMSDMERIASQGPRFEDMVLSHAERVDDMSAAEYTYIPATVLGDWQFEQEPNWGETPQVSIAQFWAGLRARNWTAGSRYFKPESTPWRVQLFRCGNTGNTGWRGLRALVTQRLPGDDELKLGESLPSHTQTQRDKALSDFPQQFWVDMPVAGECDSLTQKRVSDPSVVGYDAVLAQLYQAYQQRVPKSAAKVYREQGYVPAGTPCVCPSDKLIDVSWHCTYDHVTHPLTHFLINPTMKDAMGYIEEAVNTGGLWELKRFRDSLLFAFGPEPVKFRFEFDPNNAGPLYFVICLTLGIVIPALRRSRILDIKSLEEDPGAAMEFARSKSTARKEGLTGVQFKDVAGLGPILGEVLEVVEFLKDPRTFSKLGARPPKGILMEGDPGTGKTLLAKALAGEAMVPFYQMAGTEFTEGIVGLGAARVRDLFKRARANAPCVIFVDELDALGLKRAEGDGSGKVNEEREQTLNQLLTEMDGFTPDTGVVFIGATNRADLLDPALMRPGRFDRKIRMPKPDTEGRYEILQLHLRNKQISSDVDLMQLSRDLPGLVGADLCNIVNEAQMNAVRAGRKEITARDMYAGVDRFTQGERREPLPTTHKLPVTVFAAKEAGIALVAETLRERHGRIEPVERVSIQPKGRSYSRTLFARGTDEEYMVMTRGRLMDRIKVALSGHIAVRVIIGQETNFSLPDIKRATSMAQKLVFYYCMSDLGITTWATTPYSTDFMIGSQRPRKVVSTDAMDGYADWPTRNEDFRFDPLDPSDPTWHRYTDEVRRVIKQCYEEVWQILDTRKDALWAAVKALSEQREMLGGELRDLFDAHPAPAAPAGTPPPPSPRLDSMVIFTDKAKGYDTWPYGIEWLNDAYPVPYWVRKQQEEGAEAGKSKEPAAV